MATLNLETIKLIGNGVLDAKHVAVMLQADMLAEEAAVDTLQMSRVCAIIEDAKELLVKGDPEQRKRVKESNPNEPVGLSEFGLQMVEALYPDKYEDGTHFEHKGGEYCVDIKKTLRLFDENGEPIRGRIFSEIRDIDEQKKALSDENSRLTRLRADKVKEAAKKHPKKAQFDYKRVLKVIR